MKNVFEYDFEIQYADIDSKYHLTVYALLKYLQEVATIHASVLNYGLYDTPRIRTVWLLLDWKLQVISRPAWHQKIHIKTWPSKNDLSSCYRDFEVYDDTGKCICIATSKWVLFDLKKGSLAKITDDFKAMYKEVNKHVFDTSIIEKLKEPQNSQMFCEYIVQKRDIDTNHHVNNLIYLDLAYEVLPNDIFFNRDFKNVEIMYKHEAKLGDILHLFYTENTDCTFVTIKNNSNDKLHCIIKLC